MRIGGTLVGVDGADDIVAAQLVLRVGHERVLDLLEGLQNDGAIRGEQLLLLCRAQGDGGAREAGVEERPGDAVNAVVSEAKNLAHVCGVASMPRSFAEFILSGVEGLRMTTVVRSTRRSTGNSAGMTALTARPLLRLRLLVQSRVTPRRPAKANGAPVEVRRYSRDATCVRDGQMEGVVG